VAVKLIRANLLAGETDIRRFQTEAQAAASLRHPSIVTIHEGQHYFSIDRRP
jgi:serine/threonine protein kinase